MFTMYSKYIVVILVIVILVPSKADEANFQRIKRNGNSYKTSETNGISGFDSSRKIKEMMEKVDLIDEKLDKLETNMKKTEDILNYWSDSDSLGGHENHTFWTESTGCGGVIESSSGRISGHSPPGGSAYSRVECMWTILAGHRSKVKLTLRRNPKSIFPTDQMTRCKVLEVRLNYGSSSDIPVFVMTSISDDNTYLFRGPLLYLSCFCGTNRTTPMWVEFEGMGPNVYPQVDFVNVHLQNVTGVYDVVTELIRRNSSQLKGKHVSLISVAIPGQNHDSTASLKNILVKSLSKEFCKSSSLTLKFDTSIPSIDNVIDCCKFDCLNHKFLVLNGYCIITISVNITTIPEPTILPDFAKLAFDIQQHSKYDEDLEEDCGGVISGRNSGTISQKYSKYRANSRCIWVIHPFPYTEITVALTTVSIEDDHDQLFAVGLDDEGEIVNTTRFTSDMRYGQYNLTGRVILIVFYSDSSLQLTGFSLDWEVKYDDGRKGSRDLLEMLTMDDKITRYTEKKGTEKWNITMPPSWPGLYFSVINHNSSFTPHSYDISMAYDIVGSAKLLLYGSTNGTFNLLTNATKNDSQPTDIFGTFNYTSHDGTFLILGKIYKPGSSLSLDFNWNQGKAVVPTGYTACGGRIEPAQHGRIDFKTGKDLETKTRCVWLIECRYANVTFNLIKSGISTYAHISINTIDTETGTINNATQKLESVGTDVVVSGPLIVVTLVTSSYSTLSNTGFELEYTGSGEIMEENGKNYVMQHLKASNAFFDYPMKNPNSNDIYVFAHHPPAISSTSSLITSEKLSVQFLSHAMNNNNTSNGIGQGYKFALYSFASYYVRNYTFIPAVECTIVTGDLDQECQFLQNFTYADFRSKSETFNILFTQNGFLAIVKPLEASVGMASREFELTWNSAGCGGLVGLVPNGKIEYKLYETYSREEDCIWLVDGTKFGATSISFTLKDSGILERDFLYVYPIDPIQGTVGTATRLRYEYSYSTRNATVSSGVALVVFRSLPYTYSYGYYSSSSRSGFSLSYTLRRLRNRSSTPAGNTIVSYHNQNPMSNTGIELPFRKKMPALTKNDMVIILFNSQTSPTSISGGFTTRINITVDDLRLFVDDTSCTSDTVNFYFYSLGSFSLKQNYRSYKNPEANCSETITTSMLNNNEEPEDDYEDDLYGTTAAPVTSRTTTLTTCHPKCYESNVLKKLANSTRQFQITLPFIFIYKSNSNNEPGKKIKFSWNQNKTASANSTDDYWEDA